MGMAAWVGGNGLLLVVAYLLGSIPPGYLAGRWLKGFDIREQGSGSTGATNVLRTVGKVPALVVLLVDVLKGALAVGLTNWVYGLSLLQQWAPSGDIVAIVQPWMVMLSGLAAVLGHSQPLWLGFKGGKSVATSLGVLFALSWPVALGAAGVFGAVLAVGRMVSLGSILAAIATPILMILFQQPLAYGVFAIAGSGFVIWRHRSNIQRLLAGTEPRIGQSLPRENSVPQ